MFNDSEIYRVGDKQLDRIGRPSTLARWRVNGQGPCYAKLGGRIAYKGEDLNAWIDAQKIQTQVK